MLSRILDRVTDRLVPDSLRRDPEIFRRAKWVAAFNVAFLFWTLLFAAIYAVLASRRCALLTLLATLPMLESLALLKRGRSPGLCGNVLCAGGWITLTALAVVMGGSAGPSLFWYTCLPFVAILTAGIGWGILWTLTAFASIVLFAAAESFGYQFPQDVPPQNVKLLYFLALSCLVFCHFVLVSVRVGVEQRAREALKEANRRLAEARATLVTLERGFDFSIEKWERLKSEKSALELALRQRVDRAGESDTDIDLAELERLELELLEASDAARDEQESGPATAQGRHS